MNLKQTYGTRIWRDASTADVIGSELTGPSDNQLVLCEILGRVIDHIARDTDTKLELIGVSRWEPDPRSDAELGL